ncbi:hypothetical protein [Streptomyces sp. NPDC057545]|uniref:hypothetical protein n=1 Tax=Streptomyces sp. NPDC057545 TaxID=3346164 RepID=UPI0036B7762C
MSRIIRTIAVSGAAAAAVLGSAAVAAADTPEAVTAGIERAVNRAAGAPVSLPDGRTLHIRGLDSVSYRADAAHHTAVVTLAEGATTEATGTSLQSPQQIQTQAGAGGISTVAVAALALGIILIVGVKNGSIGKGWLTLSLIMGVLLSGTVVGPMVSQLTGSSVGMFGNFWSGL